MNLIQLSFHTKEPRISLNLFCKVSPENRNVKRSKIHQLTHCSSLNWTLVSSETYTHLCHAHCFLFVLPRFPGGQVPMCSYSPHPLSSSYTYLSTRSLSGRVRTLFNWLQRPTEAPGIVWKQLSQLSVLGETQF